VDVTFASDSAARRIRGWTVRTDMKNMSDHNHLCFSYRTGRTLPGTRGDPQAAAATTAGWRHPGWRTFRMDVDLHAAAVITLEWTGATLPSDAPAETVGAEATAERLVSSVTAACDMALPRRNPHPRRRPPVYWWNCNVAAARAECV